MSIREQILADIKEAMKAKDEFKRDTLRTLNAALKQVESRSKDRDDRRGCASATSKGDQKEG